LKEAEGKVNQEVEAKVSDIGSHVWGVGDVVKRFE
jgi:hypothetical protein